MKGHGANAGDDMLKAMAMVALGAILASSVNASAKPNKAPNADLRNGAEAALPTAIPRGEVFRLWPTPAPGATSTSDAELPTITVLRPPVGWSNGAAVIVAPGGA